MLKEIVNASIKTMNRGYAMIFLRKKECQRHGLLCVHICSLQEGLQVLD